MISRRAHIRGSLWKNYPFTCLAISVGKPAHEGADLAAAVDMIVAIGKPCVIRVSDTLQRHNFMAEGMDASEAFRKSRTMGDEWLDRNAFLLERLSPPPVIVRWDEVLAETDFESVHAAFVHLSVKDGVFSAALSRDVERFLERRSFISSKEKNLAAECSRAFLLEELAGQTLLGRRFAYARFYSGEPAEILRLVRDGRIDGAPKGLERTAFVRFNVRTQREPRLIVKAAAL